MSPLLVLAGLAGLYVFTRAKARRIAAAYPPEGRFAPAAGGRLHFTERPAEGEARATALLIHGASGNQADMMTALGAPLAAAGFRVVAVDRPGHGWSERPGGRADAAPSRQSALIRAAMQEAGVTRAIVVGHSLGGAVAANMAIEHPDFVQGLVLVAPVTHPWPGGVSWYYTPASAPVIGEAFTNLVSLPAGLALLDPGVASVFTPQRPPADYREATRVRLVLRPATFRANAQDVAGLKPHIVEQARRLGEIRAPTAIVTGDRDAIVYTHIHSYGSARDIPGATLTVLPGVGHAPHHTHPAEVVAAVEAVFARAAADPD
ncbi:MAG: alpha/beta hydrolase [Rhizobiales bacterium]|nr:alpha/beta hydrolase [Hyphomicrobiales bacterium]